MSNNKGIIDISALSTPPEKHELYTAKFFADKGKNITFICPSSIPEVYRPDILMDGKKMGNQITYRKRKKTIERNMHKAAKQSKYIIFDLRRIGLPEKQCLSQLKVEFEKRQYLCKLLIITKANELLELSRND